MKNTWKGIKSIISLYKLTNESPKIITIGDQIVTDLQTIANTFDSFFCSVASEALSEVPFSYRTFFDYFYHLTKTSSSRHLVQRKT